MSSQKTKIMPFKTSFLKVLPYFLVPIVLNVFMVVLPTINAIYYSFNNTYNYKLIFCGFDNYIRLFNDKIFWHSLNNNIIIIISTVLFQIGPAFIICALMVTSNIVIGKKYIQSIYFFPCVVASLVVGCIWKIMYSNQYGVINGFLTAVGLDNLKTNWLGDPKTAMLSIIIPLSWQFIGFYLVLLMAGATSIDKEILEVAEIDGATGFKRTLYIIIPLLKNTINICLILCISGGIRIFDQIFVMTKGGPGYASSVLAQYAYNISFAQNDFGYGSTISIMMLFITLFGIMMARFLTGGKKNAV